LGRLGLRLGRSGRGGGSRLLGLASSAGGLARDDNHRDAATFGAGGPLDVAAVGEAIGNPAHTGQGHVGVEPFAAAHHHGELDPVAAFEELPGLLDFDVQVVVIGVGPQAEFLELLLVDVLFLFFVLAVLLLTEVHDAADRGSLGRGDLDEVHIDFAGHAKGLQGGDDADLGPLVVDQTDLRYANPFIDPDLLFDSDVCTLLFMVRTAYSGPADAPTRV
jgi:hypothetical protein